MKEIGKGVHTWIFKHDREWDEKVFSPKKKGMAKRDEECLRITRNAVIELLEYEGKLIRICKSAIQRYLGLITLN